MNDYILGWHDWTNALTDWNDISISELQGMITGLLCACQPPQKSDWALLMHALDLSLPDQNALDFLTQEADDLTHQLQDPEDAYEYQPLIPDDTHDLNERLLALKDWASGFIAGFVIAGWSLTSDEQDILNDLVAIASLNPEIATEAEDEEAYLHLFEFARMVPVSLLRKNRRKINEIPLIKNL